MPIIFAFSEFYVRLILFDRLKIGVFAVYIIFDIASRLKYVLFF